VAGAVSGDDVLKNNGQATFSPAAASGWMDQFFWQVWLPASRVRLSTLTREDVIYAGKFLSNIGPTDEFARRDDLGFLGQQLIEQAKSQGGAQIWEQVAGLVASMIPVAGPLIAKATSIQSAALAGGGDWETAMGNGQVASMITVALGEDTPPSHHLLRNYSDIATTPNPLDYTPANDGPDMPLDARVLHFPAQIGAFVQPSPIKPQPTQFVRPDGKGSGYYAARLRLFTKYQGGWVLPWLSLHFNGDGVTDDPDLRTTVNRRARIYRAVDMLICKAQPWTRENPPNGYWCEMSSSDVSYTPKRMPTSPTVYFYSNPAIGPMLGSIFPPLSEDTRYVGTDGRQYSYWGEPMTNPAPDPKRLQSDANVDPRPKISPSAIQAAIGFFSGGGATTGAGHFIRTPPAPPQWAIDWAKQWLQGRGVTDVAPGQAHYTQLMQVAQEHYGMSAM
jgi:hypothetical protein